jgi:hypothetical protein
MLAETLVVLDILSEEACAEVMTRKELERIAGP